MQGATSQRSIFGYSVLQGLPAASLQETAACGAQGCVATLSELSDGTSSACRFYCRQRMKRPGTHEYFRKESLYGALCSVKVYHKLTDNSTTDSEDHLHSFLLPGRFFRSQLSWFLMISLPDCGWSSWTVPIKNAPHPALTPDMVHIVRRFCPADALSVILKGSLS